MNCTVHNYRDKTTDRKSFIKTKNHLKTSLTLLQNAI